MSRHVEIFADSRDPRLVGIWGEIQRSATRLDPFSTLWWAQAGRGYSPALESYFAVLRNGTIPAAVAAFAFRDTLKGKLLTCYARAHRDLFDMMAVEDSAVTAEAICAAIPWHEIHEVRLDGIPADSPLGPALYSWAKRSGLRGAFYSNNGALELSLLDAQGARYPDYKAVMRGTRSKRLRKRIAGLGKVEYVTASREDQVPILMSALSWLHQKRWHRTPFPSFMATAESVQRWEGIARAALEAGALHLCVLSVGGSPMAGGMGYVVGSTYYWHMVAHDPDRADYSPIRTLMSYLLDDLLADGRVNRFNYLAGEEAYKSTHASGTRPLCRLDMTRSRPRALIVSLGASFEQAARRRPRLLAALRGIKRFLLWHRYGIRCRMRRLCGPRSRGGISSASAGLLGGPPGPLYQRRRFQILCLSALEETGAADGPEVRAGTLDDFNRLTESRLGWRDPVIIGQFFERMRQGLRFYVGCAEGKQVGGIWIGLEASVLPPAFSAGATAAFSPAGTAFIVDGWVEPLAGEVRTHAAFLRKVTARLREEKACQRLLAAIDTRDRQAVRAHEEAGFRSVQEVSVTHILGRTLVKARGGISVAAS
jgi:CelD/BcsL family acetyltransferase involved in cellulose biosynthesis